MTDSFSIPAFRAGERRYFPYSRFLRERFGGPVWRVTIDAGFTCPNVDGTVAKGGCVYCDNRSFSPNRRLPRQTVAAQVERGVTLLTERYAADQFLAYFQAATNTYAPVDRLRRLYDEALAHPQMVGLIVGTRPDCVPDPVLDLLDDYAREHYVSLELGLQTMHDRSLDWMNRGHHLDAFLDAVERCRRRPFDLCVHVILGLPGESHADMMATAELLARLPVHAVKIHNLHVVKDTPLEKMYRAGQARMLELEEYVQIVCDFLERLPPNMVIQRLNGDAPPSYLVAPDWCLDKPNILRRIQAALERRDSWQGKRYVAASPPASGHARRVSLPLVTP